MYRRDSGRIVAAGSIIYRYSNQFFIRRMRELGIDGCHPPYLAAVAHCEGTNQEEISRHLHMNKGQVARVTKKLIDGGFIRREADENDKRNYRLYLTDKGKDTLPKLKALDQEFSDIIMNGMDDSQREEFLELADMAAMNVFREKGMRDPRSCRECGNMDCHDRRAGGFPHDHAHGFDRRNTERHSTRRRRSDNK